MPATLDHVRLDDPVTDRTVPEHCAAAGRRVSVMDVGGTDALLVARAFELPQGPRAPRLVAAGPRPAARPA